MTGPWAEEKIVMAHLTKARRKYTTEWLQSMEKRFRKNSNKGKDEVWVLSRGELSAACAYLAALLEKEDDL